MIRAKSLLLLGAALCLSATAQAAKPHKKGQVTIGAERLFGYGYMSQHIKFEDVGGIPGAEIDTSGSTFSLVNNPGAQARRSDNAAVPSPVFNVPRVGIDYFPADNVSVGGLVGLSTAPLAYNIVGAPDYKISGNGLLFGLRGGYTYMFQTKYGVWPRLGFTYLRSTVKVDPEVGDTQTDTLALTALNIEVPLLILATPSLGFTVGPTLETTLGGGLTVDGGPDSDELSVTEFGISAGIVGLL